MAKKKYFTTPVGKATYPWLGKPDTKYNKGGEFKVTLELSPQDAAGLVEQIDALVDARYEQQLKVAKPADKKKIVKQYPYEDVCDDEGDATGDIAFRFKMNHTLTLKDDSIVKQSPALYDKYGKEITEGIWGGSTMRVSFEPVPYYFDKAIGCSLRLRAVQVINLVSGTGGDASAFGFDCEEAPEEEEEANDFTEAAEDHPAEDDDF